VPVGESDRGAEHPLAGEGNVRVKISALWASMLFVFAYVDCSASTEPTSGPTSRAASSAGSRSASRSCWGPRRMWSFQLWPRCVS